MMALVEAARAPDYPAEVALVISNRPGAAGLARAQSAGIRTLTFDHKTTRAAKAFDDAVEAALEDSGVELVCHAGFMRIQSAAFAARWLRAPAQHPPLAAAGLQGPASRTSRLWTQACASAAARCTSSRPELDPARSSPRRPCRCTPVDTRRDARRAHPGGRAPALSLCAAPCGLGCGQTGGRRRDCCRRSVNQSDSLLSPMP